MLPPAPAFPAALDEQGDRRLVLDAVLLAAQPSVPPAGDLRQVVHRLDRGLIGRAMQPRPHQQLARAGQAAERRHHAFGKDVPPPPDEEGRNLDVLHGGGLGIPEAVPFRVGVPVEDVGAGVVEPVPPHLHPAAFRVLEHRGRHLHGRHGGAPPHQTQAVEATARIHPVQVGVGGSDDRRDGLEAGRAEGGRLEGGDAAVGKAPHPHRTVAPRLVGDPLHQLGPVVGLTGVHGLAGQAAGSARAPEVGQDGGVTPLREVAVGVIEERPDQTVLVIRVVTDHGRGRVFGRQVGVRGEGLPIAQRHQQVALDPAARHLVLLCPVGFRGRLRRRPPFPASSITARNRSMSPRLLNTWGSTRSISP